MARVWQSTVSVHIAESVLTTHRGAIQTVQKHTTRTHERKNACMRMHTHSLSHTLSLAHTRTNAGFGITIYCMHDFQPSTPEQKRLSVVWKDFDGQNWEQNILTSDIRDKTAAGGTA